MMRPKLPDLKNLKKWLNNLMSRFPYFDFKFWSKRVEKALSTLQAGSVKKHPKRLSPLVMIMAMLWTVVTIGICVGSFFTLFASLLLLYFIFTRIFGLKLDGENTIVI